MQPEEPPLQTVTEALRALAAEDSRLKTSPAVETRLRAEVRSIARARRQRVAVAALSSAALLGVAIAVPAWRWSKDAGVAGGAVATTNRQATEVTTAFFPLTYSSLPLSNAQLVRLEVPRTALASFGLAPMDVPESNASGTVEADVLVGEDGIARAVRFVRQTAAP